MLVNKKNEFVSIFSKSGKKLLKKYIKQFYLLKKGGAGAEAEAVKKRAESLKDNLTPEEKARILYMFAKREEEQKEEEEQKKLLETLPQTLTSNDILGMLPIATEHESEATDFAASDAVVDNAAVNNLWEHYYYPDTAQIYFYNKQTKKTQWEKPDGYTKHVYLPDDFDLPEVP